MTELLHVARALLDDSKPARREFRDPLLTSIVELAQGEIDSGVIGAYTELHSMRLAGVTLTEALIQYVWEQNTAKPAPAPVSPLAGLRALATRFARRTATRPVPQLRTRHVYFAQWGSRVKIGCSVNPESRLRQLSLPEGALLATIPGGQELERQIHDQFRHLRVGATEWFELGPDLVSFITAAQARHDD